jgi:hypothetical protein
MTTIATDTKTAAAVQAPARTSCLLAEFENPAQLLHAAEMIRDGYTGGRCHATIRRWWDKTNGNSYFSVTVRIPQPSGFTLFYVPYQYGHGDQPAWETVTALLGLGLFPKSEDHRVTSYPVDFEDQGYMQKGKL